MLQVHLNKIIVEGNCLKLIFLLFLLSELTHAQVGIIFHEDFGSSSTRLNSYYMPIDGFAFGEPNGNVNGKKIGKGYYAVIDPTHIKDNYPVTETFIWSGSGPAVPAGTTAPAAPNPPIANIVDHTGNSNGAVMVLHGADSDKVFYRRKVKLTPDLCYKLSYYRHALKYECAVRIDIKDAITMQVLGSGGYPAQSVSWKENSYSFKVPNNSVSNEFIIELSLTNAGNLPNLIYIDDIILQNISAVNFTGNVLTLPTFNVDTDRDLDGVPNLYDLDNDNDGTTDTLECDYCSDTFTNGSFESPILYGSYADVDLKNNKPDANGITKGWYTTESNRFLELWQTGLNGVPAINGVQLAELNKEPTSIIAEGTTPKLYQIMCVNGRGGTLTWSLWHRGRYGLDKAKVQIGSNLSNLVDQKNLETSTSWKQYSGSYTIPAGQTRVVFAIESVSVPVDPKTDGYINNTSGNLLDDVLVSIKENCIDTDGDGNINANDLDSDNDGCLDSQEYSGDYTNIGATPYSAPSEQNISNARIASRITISSQPIAKSIEACETTFFSVSANGQATTNFIGAVGSRVPDYIGTITDLSSTLNYQWQVDGVDISLSDTKYTGAQTSQLLINDAVNLNGKTYRVLITHPEHVCPTISNEVQLTVVPVPTTPTISIQIE